MVERWNVVVGPQDEIWHLGDVAVGPRAPSRAVPRRTAVLNGMGRGAVNLHGHSHGRLPPMNRQFDVGEDVRDFRPVTLAELGMQPMP